MVKIKKTVFWILIAYLAFSILAWKYSDQIADWAVTANPWAVTFVNFVTNPFYIGTFILVLELLFRGYGLTRNFFNYLRVSVASILFSLSFDIVSIIHSYRIDYILPSQSQVSIYFDTVLGKYLSTQLQPMGEIGTAILYIAIPVIMAIISLFIASPKGFLDIVKKEVGV